MCGFIVLTSSSLLEDRFVRRRGPDMSRAVTRENLTFHHYLLHITGDITPQPFEQDDVVCLFNGEIYNHAFLRSDGDVLLPLYQRFGTDFAKHLDGEFAIAIYDFRRRLAIFATDPFGTKPLFVRGIECSSYRSAVSGDRVPPNTTLVKRWNGATETRFENFAFDFSNQTKSSYDDWLVAFTRAVQKRGKPGCFVGLSSGYDSGAIACELSKLGVDFHAYSVRAAERPDILDARLKRVRGTLLQMSEADYRQQHGFLRQWCEPANYRMEAGMDVLFDDLLDDAGAVGASFVFDQARAGGRKVHLSGQGADEITSDYALRPRVSSLHGKFPEPLSPWRNFQGGCQRAYLTKEEHVAGAHGIETRYPFLDTMLVQEFLWLSAELKNRHYKAPIREYLIRNEFPFAEGAKVGFAAHLNLEPPHEPLPA
jgi:asparagine synthetase B (glutamine-hydrolysing)